jgi:hypothetical protein
LSVIKVFLFKQLLVVSQKLIPFDRPGALVVVHISDLRVHPLAVSDQGSHDRNIALGVKHGETGLTRQFKVRIETIVVFELYLFFYLIGEWVERFGPDDVASFDIQENVLLNLCEHILFNYLYQVIFRI